MLYFPKCAVKQPLEVVYPKLLYLGHEKYLGLCPSQATSQEPAVSGQVSRLQLLMTDGPVQTYASKKVKKEP
jgi:hypothetical protein